MLRACDQDLRSLAQEYLFSAIESEVGDWYTDADGYNFGGMGILVSARDMAKFGLLYLIDGVLIGTRILPVGRTMDTRLRYSEGIKTGEWLTGWLAV